MTYWISVAAVAGASFTVMTLLGSLIVGLSAPAVIQRVAHRTAAARARLFIRLRLLPAVLAAAWAFGVALPIYVWFEPRDTDETFPRTLMVAALIGISLVVRGAWRAAASWRATRRVTRDWLRHGRLLPVSDVGMPVFAIEESFPTVTVVGFSHPVMFIAERVLRECSDAEVRAMMLHECAHVSQRDNLKRFMLRACPDFLRAGGPLDRAWTGAAEEAADATAVARQPGSALALAQALIRVARLAPRVSTPDLASAFFLEGSVESRVRRLLDPNSAPDITRPLGCVMLCTLFCAGAGLVFVAAPAIHQLMEQAVSILP